jgi:hypothetical protein
MEKLKELKELAIFLANLVNFGDSAFADGKLSFLEIINGTISLSPQGAAAFNGIKNIPAELALASEQDLIDLQKAVAASLTIRDKRAELIAEKALTMALIAVDLVNVIQGRTPFLNGVGFQQNAANSINWKYTTVKTPFCKF